MKALAGNSIAQHSPLPDERSSFTQKLTIGELEAYLTVGMYPDGRPGEIFITCDKEGTMLKGMLHSFAIAISLGLQYGIPLDIFAEKFKYMRFEPEGFTGNQEITYAASIVDYIFKWLEKKFGDVPRTDLSEPEVEGSEVSAEDRQSEPDKSVESARRVTGGLSSQHAGTEASGQLQVSCKAT